MNLVRVRWGARSVLMLGVAASVAANILHAWRNPISEVIAAWPPIALLLTVELISRVPVHRRSRAVVRLIATGAIAAIAAWVSYWHMAGVAARYGEPVGAAHLLPLTVDGLIVAASISLVEIAGRIVGAAAAPAAEPVEAPPAVTLPTAKPVEAPPAAEPVKLSAVNLPNIKPVPDLPVRPKLTIVDNLPAANREGRAKLTADQKRDLIRAALAELGPGASSAEIARQTRLAEATVKYHRPALQEVSQ